MVSKAYLNKFYKQLLYVAQEIFGSYSLRFSDKAEMAYYMQLPYTDTFVFAIEEFNNTQFGFIEKYGKSIKVEVIPF